MNKNAWKGLNFEKKVVNSLKEIKFLNLEISKKVDRERDNQKIDIMNLDENLNGRFPINFQCKSYSKNVRYIKVLEEIPDIKGIINVVVHQKHEIRQNKKIVGGEYAFLHLRDFYRLLKLIQYKLPLESLENIDEIE